MLVINLFSPAQIGIILVIPKIFPLQNLTEEGKNFSSHGNNLDFDGEKFILQADNFHLHAISERKKAEKHYSQGTGRNNQIIYVSLQ